jgi:hypothetical protein
MAANAPTAKDRERFARARARGKARAQDPSDVVGAGYESAPDAIRLTFRSGGSMMIPRRIIPGLERQPLSALRCIGVSPAGDAVSWRALDIDAFIPGLLERAFGTRLFAAATGRRRGGRPRKRESA